MLTTFIDLSEVPYYTFLNYSRTISSSDNCYLRKNSMSNLYTESELRSHEGIYFECLFLKVTLK